MPWLYMQRRVDEFAHSREIDDVVETGLDLIRRHPEEGGVCVNVFTARERGAEADAELDQRRGRAADRDPAGIRLQQSAEQFQQRALARSVGADDGQRLAGAEIEADVLQRGEFAGRGSLGAPARPQNLARDILESIAQRAFQVPAKAFRHALHLDDLVVSGER